MTGKTVTSWLPPRSQQGLRQHTEAAWASLLLLLASGDSPGTHGLGVSSFPCCFSPTRRLILSGFLVLAKFLNSLSPWISNLSLNPSCVPRIQFFLLLFFMLLWSGVWTTKFGEILSLLLTTLPFS